MFFFCKQKTEYEMRISDWSSDVCSSDLQCAQNRRQCTYEGIIKGALRFGQAHGTQQHIGWDGEKAAFRKADTEKPARRMMVGRLFKRPVVKASQHRRWRSEEHTSELQSLMRTPYAVLCLKKKIYTQVQQ